MSSHRILSEEGNAKVHSQSERFKLLDFSYMNYPLPCVLVYQHEMPVAVAGLRKTKTYKDYHSAVRLFQNNRNALEKYKDFAEIIRKKF